jgi:hypothetical protein
MLHNSIQVTMHFCKYWFIIFIINFFFVYRLKYKIFQSLFISSQVNYFSSEIITSDYKWSMKGHMYKNFAICFYTFAIKTIIDIYSSSDNWQKLLFLNLSLKRVSILSFEYAFLCRSCASLCLIQSILASSRKRKEAN